MSLSDCLGQHHEYKNLQQDRNISGAFWLRDRQSKVLDFTAQNCEEIKSYWSDIWQIPERISNNHRHVEALSKNGRNALKNVNTHTHTHTSKERNKQMDPWGKKSEGESLKVVSSVYLPYKHETFSDQMNGAKHS